MSLKQTQKIVVVGAGLGGLYTAYLLLRKGIPVTIIEKSKFAGGLSGSLSFQGYQLDFGPHYISLPRDSSLMKNIRRVLGSENIVELKNIRQCYKAIYQNRMLHTSSISIPTALSMEGPRSLVKGILSFTWAQLRRKAQTHTLSPSEILSNRYGEYLFEHASKPTILHAMGTLNVSQDYLDRTFPEITPKLALSKIREKMKQRFSEPHSKSENPVIDFYPKMGMGTLARALQTQIEAMGGQFIFETSVGTIHREGKKKTLTLTSPRGVSELDCDSVVYTSPLPQTKHKPDPTTPTQARMTYLCVKSPKLFDGWVIGEFDGTRSFFRVSQQTYLSSDVAPTKSVLCVETRCSEVDPLWTLSDEELKNRIVAELGRFLDLSPEKLEAYKSIRIPNLYRSGTSTRESDLTLAFSNSIQEFGQEYLIGAPRDDGNLSNVRGATWLGGIHIALSRAETLSKLIHLAPRESKAIASKNSDLCHT